MSIYEQRLAQDTDRIKSHVIQMAEMVRNSLEHALQALLNGNKAQSYETILDDFPVNRASRMLDRLCHQFVARHLPSAGHLRFISSVLRMNVSIERIGDYASTICRESVQLKQLPSGDVKREIEHLAKDAFSLFDQAMKAFEHEDANAARAIRVQASMLNRDFIDAFSELVDLGEGNKTNTKDLFALLIILNRLERVGAHTKNLCEFIDFSITGTEKLPKQYKILFVEEVLTCKSTMAMNIAQKAFPVQGKYSCLNFTNQITSDSDCATFLSEMGHDASIKPLTLEDGSFGSWSDYHVIVSLDKPIESFIDEVPFHTIALVWNLPNPGQEQQDGDRNKGRWFAIYQELLHHITDLMTKLRGTELE